MSTLHQANRTSPTTLHGTVHDQPIPSTVDAEAFDLSASYSAVGNVVPSGTEMD